MQFKPHPYQTHAIERIVQAGEDGRREVALFLEPGLGKTVITLTAIEELIYNRFDVRTALVIAPLRVAEDTWTREAEKWDHLRHLRIAKVLGCETKRKRALQTEADIYVINRENVEWLARQRKTFDMIVIDELSSFKSHTTKRFRAMRQIRNGTHNVVGLTGTPTPNGLTDLWAEMMVVDEGRSLGTNYSGFIDEHFQPGRSIERNGQRITIDWKPKQWVDPSGRKRSGADAINEKMQRRSVSMRAEDWLTMPKRFDNIVPVTLDPNTRAHYTALETQLAAMLQGGTVQISDPLGLPNKLLQLCNGAVYGERGDTMHVHTAKLDALEQITEAANGHPVLTFYSYRHDAERIEHRFRQLCPRRLKSADDIRKWNDGNVQLMLAHPASAGHGLNLQAGGHIIVWFGLPWSLELYEQANARLHRQGQTQTVIVHHIIAEDTIDETVLHALKHKANVQNALLDALKYKQKNTLSRSNA